MNDDDLTRRVGYITGRLAEVFAAYLVTSRPMLDRQSTVFEAWDETNHRYVLDYTVSNEELRRIHDVDALIREMVSRSGRKDGGR